MQIKPYVPFIPYAELEGQANALIDRYSKEVALITALPIPVEPIADFLLELNLDWVPIVDTADAPVLAYITPSTKTIQLNEGRRAHFDQYMGSREYTLAHEVGHYILHCTKANLMEFDFTGAVGSSDPAGYLCRTYDASKDRREWQADRFASYLLLPVHLLLPAIADRDLLNWDTLYRLRDAFQVSISALTIRLQDLGLLYVAPDRGLFHTKAEAAGQLRLL